MKAKPIGSDKDQGPTTASKSAPRLQPTVKPTIAGQVRLARLRAFETSLRSRRNGIAPTSIIKVVMSVVITAVAGAPTRIRTSAFCTAIAPTPSMPATRPIGVAGSKPEPAATQTVRKIMSRKSCSANKGWSGAAVSFLQTSGSQRSNPAPQQTLGLKGRLADRLQHVLRC